MNPRRGTLVPFLVVFLLPVSLAGQIDLIPGDTVRVHSTERAPETGIVQSASAEGLRLLTLHSGNEVVFSPYEVDKLERSLGRHRRFARNFGMSVGIAAAVGGVIGAVSWSPCTETGFMACFMHPDSRGAAFGFGAGVGAMIGIPIGIIAGLTRQQQWTTVQLPGIEDDDRRLTVRPIVGRQVGLQLSLPLGPR